MPSKRQNMMGDALFQHEKTTHLQLTKLSSFVSVAAHAHCQRH